MASASLRLHRELKDLLDFSGFFLEAAQTNDLLKDKLSLLTELVYCRVADRYLVFISDVLAKVFSTRPEVLRSNEKVDLDFGLTHSSMEDLISSIIERKVLDLGFKGMREVAKYFENRLGVPLFSNEEQQETAITMIEIRNLVVHNRSIVNRIFLEKVPKSHWKLDERVDVTRVYATHISTILNAAAGISDRIESKFGVMP